MKTPTTDPTRSFVRTVVPAQAHQNAKDVARNLDINVTYLYTLVLTRELYDIDPLEYAANLVADFAGLEREELNHA